MPKKRQEISLEDLDIGPYEIDKASIRVQNNVSTAKFSRFINLSGVSMKNPEFVIQTPNHFSAAVFRIVDSGYHYGKYTKCTKRVASNVFRSGKIVTTGAKLSSAAILQLSMALSRLKKNYDENISVSDFLLRNVVVTMKIPGKTVNLDRLYKDHPDFCCYSKKIFPGLIMILPNGHRPKANIFTSASIVMPGSYDLEYSEKCLTWVYNVIYDYLEDAE